MKKLTKVALLTCVLVNFNVYAEIPYITNNGIEEVDYAKLKPVQGFKLPDSGQFRETTRVFGEENDYTRNPPAYELSKDGKIIFDKNTRLMWEHHINWRYGKTVKAKSPSRPQDVFAYKDGEPKRRPYHEGVQYCKTLSLGGYDDWRMPNIKEAHTIAHYGAARPAIHLKYFKDVDTGLPKYGDRGKGGMWGGPLAPDHPNSAWHLGFIDGHFMGYPRGGYKTTRCVRADNNVGYFLPDFVDNKNGTVTDRVANLMWVQMQLDNKKLEWEESIQYCEDLDFAGYEDWKLPSNREFTSLVDLRKQKPAIDTNFFPDIDYKAYYWTRTPETRDASRNLMSETTVQPEDIELNNAKENAWAQSFMLGANWRVPRRLKGLARCVRNP